MYVSSDGVYLNKACKALSRGTRTRAPGVLELLSVSVPTPSREGKGYLYCQNIPPQASPIVSGGNIFPYRGIGSSRLDCGDDVRHPSRLVPRRSETKTGQVRFGTLNVYGGVDDDDKVDDVWGLMTGRRLDVMCENETKQKGSGEAIILADHSILIALALIRANEDAAALNLCRNCVKPNHTAKQYKSQFKCFICGDAHHALLHLDSETHRGRNRIDAGGGTARAREIAAPRHRRAVAPSALVPVTRLHSFRGSMS
ncbi:hypothetical protein EVAR_23871_1 [Eumeta japonica]|uniref:Uncharacterized protein n=1 Tax=Eumeta variegata TaxID=151549 RepID=A0A4C1V3T6_EUMVA|nr:hypothetical protein EVAR_23871_1 [Eumeta japonica]